MVYFTGLARVARKTGYPVHEAPGWAGRGNGHMQGCRKIMIHHTAGAWTKADYNSYNVVCYGRPGLRGILAQYGVGRNTGTIYVFGAGLAWHAGHTRTPDESNPYCIGIEIENNGVGEPYGDDTYGAAVALAGELVKEFRLTPADVVGHKEAAAPRGRKTDPSFSMDQFRADVAEYLANPVTVTSQANQTTITPIEDELTVAQIDELLSKLADLPTRADVEAIVEKAIVEKVQSAEVYGSDVKLGPLVKRTEVMARQLRDANLPHLNGLKDA